MLNFFAKSAQALLLWACWRRLLLAAIPPKSSDSLASQASQIVVGEVQDIRHQQVRVRGGTNHQFEVSFKVVRDETEFGMALPEVITFYYWQTGERRKGWVGPMGQANLVPENTEIRVFLQIDKKGKFHLMEPNGWQYPFE